jgi:hypothetical protein
LRGAEPRIVRCVLDHGITDWRQYDRSNLGSAAPAVSADERPTRQRSKLPRKSV